MKNKLFYLIGVASLLCYSGTFTSCINGVDDEYLEQKITEGTGSGNNGEELPDLNGEYSMVGDFDLEMTCNGELLEGQKVVMAVDEKNETATITFKALETDLESVIGLIEGANLIQGMGLKYTGNCVIPGEKEITLTNVPLYKNGSLYAFKGGHIKSASYTMNYKGKIVDDKMTIEVNYELENQTLAGTWNVKPYLYAGSSATMTPLWFDWDTNLQIRFGILDMPEMGITGLNIDTYTPNGLYDLLLVLSPMMYNVIDLQQMIADLLQSITATPNGSIFATYAWDSDKTNPDRWSSNMSRNIIRYYFDEEKEDRLYLDINGQFLVNTIKSLVKPSNATTRGAAEDLKELGTELINFLKPALENGIPCTYKINGNKLDINIDGEFLLGALKLLAKVANNEAANDFLMPLLHNEPSIAAYATNIETLLKRLPDLLTYKEESVGGTLSGECKYVKIGLHLEKE